MTALDTPGMTALSAAREPYPSSEPPPAVTGSSGPGMAPVARFCAHCGTAIDAGMFGTRRYCDERCRARHRRGLPVVARTVTRRTYTVALAHPSYSIEPCPKCGYPEGDGGWCPDCGWTLPPPGTPGGWTLHRPGGVTGPIRGTRR
jgi:hypothetical protein